jgi:hypothetical protein
MPHFQAPYLDLHFLDLETKEDSQDIRILEKSFLRGDNLPDR